MKKNVCVFVFFLGIFSVNLFSDTTIESFQYQQGLGQYTPDDHGGDDGEDDGDGTTTGGGTTGETPEEKEKREITEVTDSLNDDKKKEEKKVDETEEGTDTDASSSAKKSEQSETKKVETAEGEAEEEAKNNQQESSEVQNASNSQTSGDPVKLSCGTYEMNEVDIEIDNTQFKITRQYDSGNSIIGSFGYGWSTNLEERIILGTGSGLQNVIDALENYISEVKKIISNLEDKLKTAYSVSSIYDAKSEISGRISNCDTYISNLNSLISKINKHYEKAKKYKELGDKVTDLKKETKSVKSKAESKKSTLKQRYDRVDYELAALDYLKQRKSAAKKKLEQKKALLEEEQARRERNQKAMFDGMSEIYEETGFETITVIDASGYPHILSNENGVWKNDRDYKYIKCVQDNKNLLLYENDGTIKRFDDFGFIIEITDRNNNWVKIVRDENEKIVKIETSNYECYEVEYKDNYISKITNVRSLDENVIYEYSGNKLTSVKDIDNDTVGVQYDSQGRMTSLKKCDGSVVRFTYGEQGSDGTVLTTSTTNEEGYTEYFEYDRTGRKTDYIDHDGNKTSSWYDENNRTVKEVRADGTIILNEYDSNGNLKIVSENGYKIIYSYDKYGNKISASYPDGSSENWTYDNYNLVTSFIDRDGVKEEYLRDAKGNIIECKKGNYTVYSQIIDEYGNVVKRTVYSGTPVVTEYKYDNSGNCIEKKCADVKHLYNYDSRNRIIKYSINNKVINEYEYNDKTIIKKDFNGLKIELQTNGRKDIIHLRQIDEKTGVIHQTRVVYDKRHLPLKVFSGDGEVEKLITSYLYTPEGKLRAEIQYDNDLWIKAFEYKYGQLSLIKQLKISASYLTDYSENKEIDESILQKLIKAAGDSCVIQKYKYEKVSGNKTLLSITDSLNNANLFEFDNLGNIVKLTDGNGVVQKNQYTKAGRLLKEQNVYGGFYSYAYDSRGFRNKAGEECGTAQKIEYNPDGSIREEIDCYGIVTKYSYDKNGRISSVQNSQRKIFYEYDACDNLVKMVVGNSNDTLSALYYVEYSYSDDGREITVTEGGKYKNIIQLDGFGNVRCQTDGNGNHKLYDYDCQNNLKSETDGYGNKKNYQFNVLGKLKLITYPDGSQNFYEYDVWGGVNKIYDSNGNLYTAEYDKAGRLIKEQNRGDCEKQYEYDKGGRITKVYYGDETVESYQYDNGGRTVSVKDGNGNVYVYNYDDFGRLVNEKNRVGKIQQYFYDAQGDLKSKNDFADSTINITSSTNRTSRTVNYSDGSKNHFVYDALGNIIESQNAYGETIYQYDQGGRLTYQKDVTTGEEIIFKYDNAGNRIKLVSSNRETLYSYGKNNELKEIFDNKQRLRVKLDYNNKGQEVLRQFGNGTKEESLYDESGRITVKMQKNERGDLLWGEGYVYGVDGKRSATIDNNGLVTLYEYNNRGQLSAVYYPYSEELKNNLKSEAELNGLAIVTDPGENRFITSAEKEKLVPLLNSMQRGLAYNLPNLQSFIKETYVYDANGNRISKTNHYGKIENKYDKENCLISSGSNGQTYVTFSYDSMGNLLTEESNVRNVKYAYNSQNRLIYCEVTNKNAKTYSQTNYAYDAFGRRIIVQDKGEAALRTMYDGLTFDVIKQSPTFENGLFTDSSETGIRWGSSGKPTGDRYRYLGDENTKDGNRYYHLEDGAYKNISYRYRGERSPLCINGIVSAQSTNDGGAEYFSTDLLCSIRSTTDTYGSVKSSNTYDAFGGLIKGRLSDTTDFGYLSKQYDSTSKLYDYGYRDYKPSTSRFTTVDPIRDGPNWFAYCNGDPVNFVDMDGLKITNFSAYSSMSDYKSTYINNTSSSISNYGCAMTGMANIITEVLHKDNPSQQVYSVETHEGTLKTVTPVDLNVSGNFNGNTDCLNWNNTANGYGLTATRSTSKTNAQSMIKEAAESKEQEYVLIQVPITTSQGNSLHWVGNSGNTITKNNETWVQIVATSDFDSSRDQKNSNWMRENGKMYVKESAIEGAVVVKKKNK